MEEAGDRGGGVHKHLLHFDADGNVRVHFFAPDQRSLEHVPIYVYDLAADAGKEYKSMVKARLARARALAPILIGQYDVPVLPLLNPKTRISHHIVRLIDSDDPQYMVDLLVRDCDYYFAGFRRAKVSSEGDEQWEWGYWFVFGDLIQGGNVPEFLKAVEMGISSSHQSSEDTMPGGTASMQDMFFQLSRFEERVSVVTPGQPGYAVQGDEAENEEEREEEAMGAGRTACSRARMAQVVKDNLKKAVGKVIVVFCEALRLRSVYEEILKRLKGEWSTVASELSPRLWKLIRGWGHLSDLVQEMLRDGNFALHISLPPSFTACYGFHTLRDLIGAKNEIMLLKYEPDIFIDDNDLEKLRAMYGPRNTHDPGFPTQAIAEED